jgi:hypothetical protein
MADTLFVSKTNSQNLIFAIKQLIISQDQRVLILNILCEICNQLSISIKRIASKIKQGQKYLPLQTIIIFLIANIHKAIPYNVGQYFTI